MARIGVDVGGTFTDLVLETEPNNGRQAGVFVHKVPSTPEDQSIGVLRGILEICERAATKLSDVQMIVHGTTVATNITIENKWCGGRHADRTRMKSVSLWCTKDQVDTAAFG